MKSKTLDIVFIGVVLSAFFLAIFGLVEEYRSKSIETVTITVEPNE